MTVNPHDAEEAMRPFLRDVFAATENALAATPEQFDALAAAEANALDRALSKACELLGVQR